MDIKKLNEQLQYILEMSPNIPKKKTGLPVVVYVSPRQGSHNCRIKFQNQYGDNVIPSQYIPFLVQDNPEVDKKCKVPVKLSNKELNQIKQWILQNRTVIEDYWYGRIDNPQVLLSKLTKLEI